MEISENVQVNSVILNVSATDADTGQNAIIKYEIVGGNEDEKFMVTNHVRSSVEFFQRAAINDRPVYFRQANSTNDRHGNGEIRGEVSKILQAFAISINYKNLHYSQ